MSFVAAVEQMAAQLKDLDSPLSDVQIMAKIIMSMPPSFRHFMSAWDSVPEADKTIADLTARLVKEETMTKLVNKGGTDPVDAAYFSGSNPESSKVDNHQALAANYPSYHPFSSSSRRGYPGLRGAYRGVFSHYNRGNRGNYRGRGGESWTVCHHCHFPGHTIAQCRKKKREDQRQDGGNESFGYAGTSVSFTARRVFDWYADSGATQHMSDQRSILINFEPIEPGTWTVTGIGNTKLFALGKGDVLYSAFVNPHSPEPFRGTTMNFFFL